MDVILTRTEAGVEKRFLANQEPGYNPWLLVSRWEGATDMLPMDLELPSIANGGRCTFDWRTYLCTLCFELRYVDVWEQRRVSLKTLVCG
jgi:hypothetical protein